MKSMPSYKPSYANTFGDFSLDPGDILKIQTDSGEELLPVFSQQMSWNGSARTTLSASGNKSREVLPKQERDEYGYRQAVGGQMRGFGQKQKTMEDRLSYAEIDIDEDKAQIQLITGRVDGVEGRISSAEITLNGADGQIGLVGRVETAEGDIKSAEVKIDGLNSEIELKADKITLDGYVTMSKFNAEIAEIKITDSSYVTTAALNTKSLSANYAEISSINIGGKQARWESVTVVTGVTRKKRYAMAPSGTTNMEFYECASVSTDTFTLLIA
jgi:hypothetical protein